MFGLKFWYGGGGAGGYLWYGVVWGKRRVGIHLLSESRQSVWGKGELCRGCFEGWGVSEWEGVVIGWGDLCFGTLHQ